LLNYRYDTSVEVDSEGTSDSSDSKAQQQQPDEVARCIAAGAAAIENVPDLLHSAKPQQVVQMSVYAHLRRLGLEHLASLFEHFGYDTKSSLKV